VPGVVPRSSGDLEEAREPGIAVDEAGGEEGAGGDQRSGGEVPDDPQSGGWPAVPRSAVPKFRAVH
jgi:hypothetical protein